MPRRDAGVSNCNAAEAAADSPRPLAAWPPEEVARWIGTSRSGGGVDFLASEWEAPDLSATTNSPTAAAMVSLREPAARLRSSFGMRCKLGERRQAYGCASGSLEGLARAWPDNKQTRQLCGLPCLRVPWGKLTEEHLEAARQQLERFDVVRAAAPPPPPPPPPLPPPPDTPARARLNPNTKP